MTTPKKVVEAPVEKPTETKKKAKPAVEVKTYVSVNVAMYHPFMGVTIPTGPPGITLDAPDSWLECQIDRGLIKEM